MPSRRAFLPHKGKETPPMRLEEKHKEFVVQGYARFMKRSEIVEAFIEEFNDEIYQLCIADTTPKKKRALQDELDAYIEEHGLPITKTDVQTYVTILSKEMRDSLEFGTGEMELREEIRAKRDQAKAQLSARFRRLDITHAQFPEKYRALFNETREQYLATYRSAHLSIPENVILELETLYGLTKELAFEQRDLKHITQATQILKTIAACNAVNEQREPIDITPQDEKALEDTQKTLAAQVKKETRQLAKHTKDANA